MNNMYTIGGNSPTQQKGGKALRYLSPSTSVEGGQRRKREVDSHEC
jgi:hypothetical protein